MAKENSEGRRMKRSLFSLKMCVVLAGCLSTQTVLAADPPPAAPTNAPTDAPVATSRADALFTEGKLLMEQGKFVEACDKLAESDALDPAIGTLGLLATCHEQQGRIATAWREYTQTAARADAVADDRGTFARERAKALEPQLPKLLVRLAVPDANVVVLRNGVRLTADELGVEAPIDPGTYEIVARWPDKPEFRTTVTVVAHKHAEVEIQNPTPPVVEKPRPVETKVGANLPPQSKPRVGPWIAAGVGLAGFGVGTAFAISAASKNSTSVTIENSCVTAAECQSGKDLREQAFTAATIANVAVGVGIVGAGTAIVLALLPNHSPTPASKTKDARLVPYANGEGGGAFVIGHF